MGPFGKLTQHGVTGEQLGSENILARCWRDANICNASRTFVSVPLVLLRRQHPKAPQMTKNKPKMT